jgi:hypothetical protein
VIGGISVGLWKDEHQTHHLVTNDVEHDPDIQLIPFVATTTKFFKSVHSSFHDRKLTFTSLSRKFVKYQHIVGILYVPAFKLLLYIAAPLFAIFSPRSQSTVKEIVLMLSYYAWFFYLLSYIPEMRMRVLYFFANNIMTSIVFLQIVLAHLPMPTDPFTKE